MKKEILQKLIESGEVIHLNYAGVIKLNKGRYLVYWVAQQDIDELDISADEDPVKVRMKVATVSDGTISFPQSTLDYLPTSYKYIREKRHLDAIDDFAGELREKKDKSG